MSVAYDMLEQNETPRDAAIRKVERAIWELHTSLMELSFRACEEKDLHGIYWLNREMQKVTNMSRDICKRFDQ